MNAVERLIEEDLKRPRRILIVGDGMQDVYVHGHLHQCQDGCPKFVEESYVEVGGGACNAARSLMHWHARKVCLFTPGAATKTRFMIDGKCVWRYDDETPTPDHKPAREETMECLRVWQPEGVLISDYDKGLLSEMFLREIIAECKRLKVPCVADAKRAPEFYHGAIIKGNSAYWECRKYPTQTCVVTRGEEPPYGYSNNAAWTLNPRGPVKCVNHVGAGDCFAAHLTLALACGLSLKDGAVVAHCAGRVYVQRPHNSPPTPQEVLRDSTSTVTA